MSKSIIILLFVLISIPISINAQNKLIVHSESIDSLFFWFNNGSPANDVPYLLKIPANQIMEQLLFDREKDVSVFSDALLRFKDKYSLPDNDYLLNDAYNNRHQINILKDSLIEFTLENQPMEYVKGFFPADFNPSSQYDIYFTATGWKWGDAMAFNYSNNGGNLILSDEGTAAIIFNLTIIASTYGNTIAKQTATYKKVLIHELFHAFLNDYIAGKNYYTPEEIESNTLFMLMNEGIAHYIADCDYIKDNYETLKEKELHSFSLFNENANIIFDKNKHMELRSSALENGLFGSYWDKYICMTGLFMAYHIHQYGGQELLQECIANGGDYFIIKYSEICNSEKHLPQLPEIINQYLVKR